MISRWTRRRGAHRERGEMARVINCECGYVVRGETDDELVAEAERHIQQDHPDMVGKVSREDLLGMAEDA
jgi:predicted small metal-binding protein